MANRLVDNVILVDSAMGNLPVVGGASSNITNFEVTAFAFLAGDTSGACIISGANTTDHIFRAAYVTVATGNAGVSLIQSTQFITFSKPLRLGSIKCPTLTAGSAWVYLA